MNLAQPKSADRQNRNGCGPTIGPAFIAPLLVVLIFAAASTFPGVGTPREKVAEGQYAEWKNGQIVRDTNQSWTLWRDGDGFELEDELPRTGAALMAVTERALWSKMSPELQRELQDSTTTTNINLKLATDKSVLTLSLIGVKFSDLKTTEVAQCSLNDTVILCKGRKGKAHLRRADQLLSYSYPFPLLFVPLVSHPNTAESKPAQFKLAVLQEADKELRLIETSGQLQYVGQEQLTIAEYNLLTEKYVLTIDEQGGPRQITLWASHQGIVYGMEDSKLIPGLRVLLTQYKKYSDF